MKRLIIIQQGLKAPKDKRGNGYKFRSAEDIFDKLKPLLQETQTAVVASDEILDIAGRVMLRASVSLCGEDGNVIAGTYGWAELDAHTINGKQLMSREQATGCASSYARKYALCGLFAIDNDENDPDQPNIQPAPKQTAQQPAKPVQQPQKPKGLIASASCAIDLNVIKRQLDEYLQAGKMSKEQHAEKELELLKRAKELDCTFDAVEGFIDNRDLFAE